VLLWSGGCDSTLVLSNLARDSTENNPVRTLAVIHPDVKAMEEQSAARKKVLKWMKGKGHHVLHQEVEFKHSSESVLCPSLDGVRTGSGANQYPIWLVAALSYLEVEEDLHVGYIRGDDIWEFHHDMQESFKSLLRIVGKKGELKFPLDRTKKTDVIDRLKDRGLYDLTWHCETPRKGERCGTCDPCIKHDVSLYELELNKKRWDLTETAFAKVGPRRKK